MAAMKRGLPRLVFAPLNRLTPIALNLEPEPAACRLPFSHQTRSEQYLADKTILGRNKSQIAPLSLCCSLPTRGDLLCRQNPLLLNGELLRHGQETRRVGGGGPKSRPQNIQLDLGCPFLVSIFSHRLTSKTSYGLEI